MARGREILLRIAYAALGAAAGFAWTVGGMSGHLDAIRSACRGCVAESIRRGCVEGKKPGAACDVTNRKLMEDFDDITGLEDR